VNIDRHDRTLRFTQLAGQQRSVEVTLRAVQHSSAHVNAAIASCDRSLRAHQTRDMRCRVSLTRKSTPNARE
jgi:hypothetical protein